MKGGKEEEWVPEISSTAAFSVVGTSVVFLWDPCEAASESE
jgi:hypothetical protein